MAPLEGDGKGIGRRLIVQEFSQDLILGDRREPVEQRRPLRDNLQHIRDACQ